MPSRAIKLQALSLMMTASLAGPALADLVGRTVDPSEIATRAGNDSGAQVDSFFGDVGNFFQNVGEKIEHGAEKVYDKVSHSSLGEGIGHFGQDMYHGRPGDAVVDLGKGIEGTNVVQGAEKAGKELYHGQVGDALVTAGETYLNHKFNDKINLGSDMLNGAGINAPHIAFKGNEAQIDSAQPAQSDQ